MKTCKSPETRFPKVSRRSEPCSRGKRPFEVSKKNRNSRVSVRKGNVAQELQRFGAVLVLRYRLYPSCFQGLVKVVIVNMDVDIDVKAEVVRVGNDR